MDVINRILELRNAKNLNTNQLAKLSDLSYSTLYEIIESRKKQPSIITLEKICSGLGVTLAEFFAENPGGPSSLNVASFAIDPRNHALIKDIKALQAAGYSNETIQEWITSMHQSLLDLAAKYGIMQGKPQGKVIWAKDDLTPEEEKLLEKFRQKLKDPNFKPPWE